MGLIHVLDTDVSNKIAAGEVVEKPLSIVKELTENSIDAGASLITVEIRGGGISYIRVSDNGCGMSAEDAKVCFLRHATSKIRTGRDLEEIYTLGFRGEALSSIGAVSKVKLYTKRRQDESGVCVTCEGGEILSSDYAGAPNGTVVEVSELFYNTPARLKFLKKPAAEAGYISDLMARYIFAHPEISFKLIRDGKEILFSSGDNKLINAIYAVYGKDFAKNMLEVDYLYNDVRVTGMIGKGTLSKANRNNETFFVNSRYIKSAIMIRALEEAYKNQIMISKFPTAVLNIEVAAGKVDINVHPTKLECKFSDENEIYRAVYHAVRSALYELPNVPQIERSEPADTAKLSEKPPADYGEPSAEEAPVFQKPKTRDIDPLGISFETARRTLENRGREEASENGQKSEPKLEPRKAQSNPFVMLDYAKELGKKIKAPALTVKDSEYAGGFFEKLKAAEMFSAPKKKEPNLFDGGDFRVIGQLFDTYILIEKGGSLLMLDQHAAHERLNFEALKLETKNAGVTAQLLIEPVEVRLSGGEYAAYTEHEKELSELGFETKSSGEGSVSLCSVPGEISVSEAEPLFLELLTQLSDMANNPIGGDRERLLYTISCKAAIKANRRLCAEEMEDLAKRVFALKNINTCPHGRPIVIAMSKKEIEKEFKRIV